MFSASIRALAALLVTCAHLCAETGSHTGKVREVVGDALAPRAIQCGRTVEEVIEEARRACGGNGPATAAAFELIESANAKPTMQFAVPDGLVVFESQSQPETFQQKLGIARDPNPFAIRKRKQFIVYYPDLLTLYQTRLACGATTVFAKSLDQFWTKTFAQPSRDGKAKTDPSVQGFAKLFQRYANDLSVVTYPGLTKALQDEIAAYRSDMMRERGECSNAPIKSPSSEKLRAMAISLHDKAGSHFLKSAYDLSALANEEERQLIAFLYGPGKQKTPAADALIGKERADALRNAIAMGELKVTPQFGALSITPTKGGVALIPEKFATTPEGKALQSHINWISNPRGMPMISSGEDFGSKKFRPVYQEMLDRLTKQGVNGMGDAPEQRLRAERVRSFLVQKLTAMDFQTPTEKNEVVLPELVSERKAKLMTGSNPWEHLSDARWREVMSHQMGEDKYPSLENLKKGEQLYGLHKFDDRESKFRRATDLQLLKPEARALLDSLSKGAKDFRESMWTDYGAGTTHFYGRQLAQERGYFEYKEMQPALPLIDRVDRALGKRGLALGAEDRIRLQRDMSLFSLGLLAAMLENAPATDKAENEKIEKKGFAANTATFAELAAIVFEPKGKDALVQAHALMSRMNFPDSDQPLRAFLKGELANSKIQWPAGLDVAKADLTEEEAQTALDEVEKQILAGKLTRRETDTLAMLGQVLRSRGHSAETLYGELAVPSDVAANSNATAFALRLKDHAKDLKNLAAAGEIGKKALADFQEVKKSLGGKYGVPLAAENAALKYLLRSPDIAPKVFSQLAASMPQEKYASLVAKINSKTPGADMHVMQGEADAAPELMDQLRVTSPQVHHLLNSGEFQAKQVMNRAVKEMIDTGKLSEQTASMLPALLPLFPQCEESKEPATCLIGYVVSNAVTMLVEAGKHDQASRILEPLYPDKADRDEHLAQVGAILAEKKRARELAPCLDGDLRAKIKDPNGIPYEDGLTGAEAMRRRAYSRWSQYVREIEEKMGAKAAESLRDFIRDQVSLALEKGKVEEYMALAKKSFPFLTKDQLLDYLQLKKELGYQANPPLTTTAKNFVTGPFKAADATEDKWGRVHDYRTRGGYYDATEASRLSEVIEKKLVESMAMVKSLEAKELITVNKPAEHAWKILRSGEHRRFPVRLPTDGVVISTKDRVGRLFNLAQTNNEAFRDEIFEAVSKLASQGTLSGGDGGASDDEVSKAFFVRMKELTLGGKQDGKLSDRVQAQIALCEKNQKACGLTPSELDLLRELYADHQKSKPGELTNLDSRATLTEGSFEAMRNLEDAEELREFRFTLLDFARSSEPAATAEERIEAIKEAAKLGCNDSGPLEPRLADRVVSHQQGLRKDLLWGKSIADALVRTPGVSIQPGFAKKFENPAERAKWLKAHGGLDFAKDWVSRMSSGVAVHRMPEEQAWRTFGMLLEQTGIEAAAVRKQKGEIESRMASVGLKPSGHVEGDLWNWDDSKLHLVSGSEQLKPGQKLTRQQFFDDLNNYFGLVSKEAHALNPAVHVKGMGEDELHGKVHTAFMNSGYSRDTAAMGHTLVTLRDDHSDVAKNGAERKNSYEFKDWKAMEPKIQQAIDRVAKRVANNGELQALIDKRGSLSNMSKRMFGDTAEDKKIEAEFHELSADLNQLMLLGTAPVKLHGETMPADKAWKQLSADYGRLLSHEKEILDGILKGYGIAEDEVGWTIKEMVIAGILTCTVGPEGVAIVWLVKGAHKLKMMRRLASVLLKYRHLGRNLRLAMLSDDIWWIKKARDFGKATYNYAKLGAQGAIYSAPVSMMTGRARIAESESKANEIDKDPENGIPDWQEARDQGKSYHFPPDVRPLIDIDDNGIPDSYDINVRNMPIDTYTIGSVNTIYEGARDGGMTMAPIPLAGAVAKATFLRPIASVLENVGGKVKRATGLAKTSFIGTTPIINSFEQMAGMIGSGMVRKHMFSDAEKGFLEELRNSADMRLAWSNLKNSVIDSTTGVAPFDDIGVLTALKMFPDISPQSVWAIKAAVNHAQDFVQPQIAITRDGEWRAANGMVFKERMTAGMVSVLEGAYMSQKASSARNSFIDALPKLIMDDIIARSKAGEVNIKNPLLDKVLVEGYGNQPGKTVRDLIFAEANLGDFQRVQSREAFFAVFTAKLLEQGVPEAEVRDLFEKTFEKTGGLERRFGEVAPFVDAVAREYTLAKFTRGEIPFREVSKLKTASGAPRRLERRLSVNDAVKPGTSEYASPGVREAVVKIAKDFGVDADKFEKYVFERAAKSSQLGHGVTLGLLAKEFKSKTYY